jgi:hypothetical protein
MKNAKVFRGTMDGAANAGRAENVFPEFCGDVPRIS